MIYSLITNDYNLAKIANECGIDRIMIDLEFLGKKDRQKGFDLFHSTHSMEDIKIIKKSNPNCVLVVRVNQVNKNSKDEITEVIDNGADFIMLPYFKTLNDVETFLTIINNKVKSTLLIETSESINLLNDIIKIDDVEEYHIGLNDLALSCNNKNIFQSVLDGTIENSLSILKKTGKKYGFGGVGSLNNRNLIVNPRLFFFEQLRNECKIGWLGRSFRNEIKNNTDLSNEVKLLVNQTIFYENLSKEEKNNFKDLFYQQVIKNEEKLDCQFKQFRI